jgi:tetratricopeptide (TPR) repeat protein
MSRRTSNSMPVPQPVSGKRLPVTITMLFLCVLTASLTVLGQVAPSATDNAITPKPGSTPRHSPKRPSRGPRPSTGISRSAVSEQSDRFVDLGDQFAGNSKWHAAEAAYREAINLSPGNADAWAGLGTLFNDQGRHGEAFTPLNKARGLDPSNALANYGLGYAQLRQQKYNDAVSYFKQALNSQRDFPQAYFDLGLTYLAQNNKLAALDQYEKLKEFDAEMAQELLAEINKK